MNREYWNGEKINGYETRDRVKRAQEGIFAAGMTNVLAKRTVRYWKCWQSVFTSTFSERWLPGAGNFLSKSTSPHKPSPGDGSAHIQCYVRIAGMLSGYDYNELRGNLT